MGRRDLSEWMNGCTKNSMDAMKYNYLAGYDCALLCLLDKKKVKPVVLKQ